MFHLKPIIVAARSNERTVFARWNARVVSSNPTRGLVVCLCVYSICVILCRGRDFETGSSPVPGEPPTACRIEKLRPLQRTKERVA
jgi:hypothetical protein